MRALYILTLALQILHTSLHTCICVRFSVLCTVVDFDLLINLIIANWIMYSCTLHRKDVRSLDRDERQMALLSKIFLL